MRIHCHLKELIEERGMSQKELAQITGIREATISAICKNEMKRYPVDVMESIVDALNITDMNVLFSIKQK